MIKLIAVGKIKDKPLLQLIEDYRKRINNYHRFEIVEVMDYPTSDHESEQIVTLKKEGVQILQRIKSNDYVIILDLKGKMIDSVQMAQQLDQLFFSGHSNITYIIGGSLGLDDMVKQRANASLCLSKMTFPHGIVRLLWVEQIYRSFKILAHEPYHK